MAETFGTRTSSFDTAWAVDDLPLPVLCFEHGQVARVNQRWVELTGLGVEQSAGRGWLRAIHSNDASAAARFARTAGTSEESAEWRVVRRDGRDSVWVQANAVQLDEGHGHELVVTLTEIESHKEREAGLLHRASHDALTGLLTHDEFMDRVADAVEGESPEDGLPAVLYLDVDFFKEINDTYGHQIGDQVLTAVSRRITSSLRPSDTVARLGGDEIGVLLPTVDSEDEAIHLADRIVDVIRQPFTIDENVLHLSVSVGVGVASGTESSAADLVEQADQAMYRAKASGRAGWATLTTQSRRRLSSVRVDVGDLAEEVTLARSQLDQLLDQIDLRDPNYTRLAQVRQALGRAALLLDGEEQIG